MSQLMKVVGYGVAALGAAYVVKHIKHRKESSRGWHKIKVEEEKSAGATAPHETKAKEEKRTGTRYGSSPIRY
ncbi:hypothetical protein EQO05_00370 [Methanosarcina sp. MSH10X1]|uniref:hypothetical protein n=1 Tax=Methanosarcina sp. MSH10X1 TaxID=2507075 RepID=UPI000FFB1697|nr:hypothetical protein [Methanosarcina sp. MSH10X1]RXA21745.1 hypothetical protein EQO05_00370 [Methanosarcina sp. MSH10X1]